MSVIIEDLKTKERFIFPMQPEEITCETVTRFISYNVMGQGEIKIPDGEQLTGFSWEGILPGEKRKDMPYVTDWVNPKTAQELWSRWRTQKSKLHLIVEDTPISHDVYINSYTVTYKGGFGDYFYNISFSHAKDVLVEVEDKSANSNASSGTKSTKAKSRPTKPKSKTYTVKVGDSLWAIAQKQLGKGSRWNEIYRSNKSKIKNPNLIYPGQVFVLP